jgi:ABC-type nickel/cobalt efflux system permease component RcnA
VLVALIGWKRSDAQAAVGTLETVSFALIALLGLGLAARALWSFGRGITTSRAMAKAKEGCGHAHAPDLKQLDRPLNFKTFAAVVLSIGIRPCSGAVLVLLFAEVLGLRWAGIAAVLAMSLGTAATVGVLAALAVNFRRLAAVVAGGAGGGRHFALAGQAVALLGGVLITALGASLFFGSLGTQHPLL